MTGKPLLGPESPGHLPGLCSYAPQPGALHCARPATWHGIAIGSSHDGADAGLESCDGHLPQMRLTADYVHPMKHPCGIPGSLFSIERNECFTDWDQAGEFSAAEMAEVPKP